MDLGLTLPTDGSQDDKIRIKDLPGLKVGRPIGRIGNLQRDAYNLQTHQQRLGLILLQLIRLLKRLMR